MKAVFGNTARWAGIAFGAVALVQGCALEPEHIRVDPAIELSQAAVGGGKSIGVAVADTRTTKKLGEVGDPNRGMMDITLAQDPSPAIYARVSAALDGLGYKVTPQALGEEPTLAIEVVSLKLDSDKRAFDFLTTLHAQVAARVDNGRSHFERTYTVNQSINSAGPAYIKESSRLVNAALSSALQDMLSDPKLLDTLNK